MPPLFVIQNNLHIFVLYGSTLKLLFKLVLEHETEFRFLKGKGGVLICRIRDEVGSMVKGVIPPSPRGRYASIHYPMSNHSTVTDLAKFLG